MSSDDTRRDGTGSGGTGSGDANSGGTSGLPDGDRDDMGHGIVNDGPDNERADAHDDLFEGDELALRRLLHGAVADLQPTDGALDHLRRAVPARRTRKRQAVVGFAAAAVLLGTAVPAFVHVAGSGGITADQAVNAGHGEQAQGGTGSETGVETGGNGGGTPPGTATPSQGAEGGTSEDSTNETGGGSKSPSGSSPACDAAQLAISSVQAGGPDAEGKVYGTFRVANVSGKECVVSGDGSVGFQALGAADPAKISVVAHTPGDAASGLPDPSQESSILVLRPDSAYEVKFAWVPAETCPTTGTPPDPEPTPSVDPSPSVDPTPSPTKDGEGATSGASGSTGNGETVEGTAPQFVLDGTPADGSIAVSHTAEPGGPQAATTIPNACAGTIYRTGVLDAS
ncbi:hypothetical protein ABZ946_27245 [Streptomyces sp. NPDC046324]|uniref:hypothetical protein n=1 Tax=Streptomyces sp. NPDC046324 TaxID=3154915 RepID=UPI0033CCD18F